jgi:hypothetical protein
MYRHIANFVIGASTTAGAATALDGVDPNQFSTLEELLKYVISIFGGILATIILNLLKKKFPEWFNSKKAGKTS